MKFHRAVLLAVAGAAFAILAGGAASATTHAPAVPAVHYVKQPSWLYIDHASRAQRQATCGYWPHTHKLVPGVLVTSGDTAVMFCKNGRTYSS